GSGGRPPRARGRAPVGGRRPRAGAGVAPRAPVPARPRRRRPPVEATVVTPTRRGPARVPAALGALKRALYRGGRPGRVARLWNRVDAALYAAGVGGPRQAATLEVVGRVSGRAVTTPVAFA